MDKIVRNDIKVNLTSVEKIMVFKIDYNAQTMHVFLPTCKLLILFFRDYSLLSVRNITNLIQHNIQYEKSRTCF